MKKINEINELFMLTVLSAIVGSFLYANTGLRYLDYSFSLIYSQFILALPTLLYVIIKKVSIKELFRFHKIKIGTIFLLILFAFLIMPLMQEINLISMLFTKNAISSKMYSITDGKPFIYSAFLIAFLPAFLEESVYRGCFFHTYSKVSPIKAVFLSALFFGLMHGNFNQFSYAFVMGAIFCLVVEGTDSIVSSMVIHFMINFSSVVMIYVSPILIGFVEKNSLVEMDAITQNVDAITRDQLLMSILIYGMIACFTTVLAVLVFVGMVKHEGRWEHVLQLFRKRQNRQGEGLAARVKLGTIPMYIGIGICLFTMIYGEIAG